MKYALNFLLAIMVIGSLGSCKKGTKGEKTLLPNVTGSANEIVLVLHKQLMTDSVGIAYKEILSQEFPFLPQSEPLFDLVSIPPQAFTDIFKSHRNLIINEKSEEYKEAKFIIKRDVWAAPQTVVYVVGPNYDSIARFIKKERYKLVAIFEQAERDRIIQGIVNLQDKDIISVLQKKFNITMSIPKGYRLGIQTDNFVWLVHETPKITQGIFIYSFPYKDKNTFSSEYLMKQRNEFIKIVEGPTKGSYMTTSTVFPPDFSAMMYRDRYYGVLRGFWDVYKHPMGGPFISFSTLDEKRQNIINAEAFVYAPSSNKRNYLRQVEALLYTLEIQ